ncbi:MAG: metal-dependent hydrolase [Candidatus Omnitrophica bacterium]|nr:metal-dependent hydrolase [Candidatus Omnitrophota bacterium]
MPLPVIHSFAGYSVYCFAKQKDRKTRWPYLLFFVLLAALADFDFLPGLFIQQAARFHRGPSHSLAAAFIVAFMIVGGYHFVKSLKSEIRNPNFEANQKSEEGNNKKCRSLANRLASKRTVSILGFDLFGFVSSFEIRISKFIREKSQELRLFALSFLAYSTHVILDMFSAYGVPLFWPFSSKLYGYSLPFLKVGRLGVAIHHIEGFQDFLLFLMSPAFLKPVFFELAIVFSIWSVVSALVEMRERIKIHESVAFVRAVQASIFIFGFMVT